MNDPQKLRNAVAYSYARFSNPSQGQGHSLERQQDYAPEFCKEYGCKLNTSLTFADRGKSAFHGKHIEKKGGLHKFLECIDAGMVQAGSILIVENLDRVSRLPLDEAQELLKHILARGVRIHTRSPWRIYDQSSLRDLSQLLPIIFELSRSHQESEYKQQRLARRWAKNRDQARAGEYRLARIPAWLQPVRVDGKIIDYKVDKIRAKVVRRIFNLCVDGFGLTAICKQLNRENTPTFGKANFWQRSSVSKVLHNRAVFGEYQPYSRIKHDGEKITAGTRSPEGKPIPNYYPAIIEQKTFNIAQLALKKRYLKRTGPGSEKVTNLFPGLMQNATDEARLTVVNKGYGPRLVAAAAVHGKGKTHYVPYQLLEDGFALFVDQMPLELLAPKHDKKVDQTITIVSREIQSIESQIDDIKEKFKTKNSPALLDLLLDREEELSRKNHEFETLQRTKGSSSLAAATSSAELLSAIRKAKPADLTAIRTKLRQELSYWVKKIVILPLRLGKVRAIKVSVELQNGKWLEFQNSEEQVMWPTELAELSAHKFRSWPKHLQKTSWQVNSTFDAKLRKLHASGLPFAIIAEELGSTISTVSKRALALGLRKSAARTKFTKQSQMCWHPTGRGWVRAKAGQRYYIGCGKLKSLYPRLVKTLDEEGTRAAATRWWRENVGN